MGYCGCAGSCVYNSGSNFQRGQTLVLSSDSVISSDLDLPLLGIKGKWDMVVAQDLGRQEREQLQQGQTMVLQMILPPTAIHITVAGDSS